MSAIRSTYPSMIICHCQRRPGRATPSPYRRIVCNRHAPSRWAHAPFGYRIAHRSTNRQWVSWEDIQIYAYIYRVGEVVCLQFALHSRWRPATWSASSWTSTRIPPSVPLASCATARRTSTSVPQSLPERRTVCACSSTTITCPGCHASSFCCAAMSARICAWCSTTSSRMWWRRIPRIKLRPARRPAQGPAGRGEATTQVTEQAMPTMCASERATVKLGPELSLCVCACVGVCVRDGRHWAQWARLDFKLALYILIFFW